MTARLAVFGLVLFAVAGAARPAAGDTSAVPTARLVSVGDVGQRANGSSIHATVSDDGRRVAFSTTATNLGVLGNIAVRDMRTGTLTSVDVTPGGARGNGQSQLAYISGDGRFVAFNSTSSDLVPGDTNGVMDVFLRDLELGTTERVSVSLLGGQANGASSVMGTSRDGRITVFGSLASNLSPADQNGAPNMFVHDGATRSTFPVDVDGSGMTSGFAGEAFVSEDGRFVEFMTTAALSPADVNGTFDVYLRALETGVTTLVSSGGGGGAFASAISADGRYAGFGSLSTSPSTPTPGFVRDVVAGTTTLFNSAAFPTGISADGARFVATTGSLISPASVWIRGAGIQDAYFPTGSSFHLNTSPDGGWSTIVSRVDAVLGIPDVDSYADVYLVGLDWPDPYVYQRPITVDATSDAGVVVTFTPTVIAGHNPVVDTACDPASGSTFPVGTTVVHCVATDSEGVTGTAAFTVTVRPPADTTPPTIGVPGDLAFEATGPTGAVVAYSVTFSDPDDAVASSSCAPASGSLLGLGSWQVLCFAQDTHGNSATASFRIDVVDTTAPVLAPPPDLALEAVGPGGAVVEYDSPVAADLVDGVVPAVCSPASGSLFPLGRSEVTCNARDAHGNSSVATFVVDVVDTTAPVLAQPSDLTVDATGPGGAVVGYDVPDARDAVDGLVDVDCVPVPGTLFTIGATPVTCTARDAHGNAGTVTFTVGVLGAEEQLTALMAVVAQLPNERLADSLNAKLRDARAGLQAGKTNKACGNLADFAKQVAQQAGKGIPAEQADEWQADATSIRPVIGC